MTKTTLVSLVLGWVLSAGPAFAHHGPSSLGSIRLTHAVQVGGTTLQPGMYEVRLTGEHMPPLPGQSEDAVQGVEIVQNGQVVAKDAATVMPESHAAVGTSGGQARGRVEMLKGGDFVRASFSNGTERFLLHFAVAQ